MVENFLRNGPFLVEVAVVPPAIHVVTDKPSHGRPRHDIAGKVLPCAHPSHHHGRSEAIGQNRNDPRMRILVGDHRGQCPRIDGVSRRKPGVQPAVGAVPKVALTVAFERSRAVGRQFEDFHNKGAVDQSFECQQAGFAQPFLVRAGSDEIDPGADRDQGVRGAGERRPLADRHLTRRVGKLFHRPPIGGDERRGGGSEDGPEFYILFAGVKRTGPDGLLVLQNVLWHAQEWTENPRSFPQVLLLWDRRPRFHLRGRWLGAIRGLLLFLGVRFGLSCGRRLAVRTATRWGRLAEHRGCEKPKKESPTQSHRPPTLPKWRARGWPFAGNTGGGISQGTYCAYQSTPAYTVVSASP